MKFFINNVRTKFELQNVKKDAGTFELNISLKQKDTDIV